VKAHEVEAKKERFFYRKRCAYCGTKNKLCLDSVKPFTWVGEEIWEKSEYDLNILLVCDIQVLCDRCLRRKKQVWKAYKKEGGDWLVPYLQE
jgi:hypothetical protein